jgi:hypothetical protein
MSDDDLKNLDLDKIDCGKALDRTFEKLGQVSYSFFVDQQSSPKPSNTVPNNQTTGETGGLKAGNSAFVHPAQQRQRADNSIDPGAKYTRQMSDSIAKATELKTDAPAADQNTFEGAVERQTGVGFSSKFNFIRSIENLFKQLDVNHDGRLSKSELNAALADGSFNGDDELLLILLLRHIGDIAGRPTAAASDSTLNITLDCIRRFPGWQQYISIYPDSERSSLFKESWCRTKGNSNGQQ